MSTYQRSSAWTLQRWKWLLFLINTAIYADAEDIVQEASLVGTRDEVAEEPEVVEIAEYQSDDDDDFRAEGVST